jgi:osmotically-inducible protein OsmY
VIRSCLVAASLIIAGLTSACDPITIAAGGAATVGVAAAEERGVEAAADDTKIRAAINEAWFHQDAAIFQKLSLTVNEGRVMVTGVIQTQEQHDTAIRLVWQVAGVRQVYDEIQIADSGSVGDYSKDVWIANDMRSRLMFDSQIKNVNYTVDVVNGVVYLMGIAQNEAELDRAIAHARDISGVRKVISHVIMKDDPQRHAS